MTTEIQSILALGVVAVTLGIFIFRALRSKKTGCGGACGCPQKTNLEAKGKSSGSL